MDQNRKGGLRASMKGYFLAHYQGGDFLVEAKAGYSMYLAFVLAVADILPVAFMILRGFNALEAAFRLASALIILLVLYLLRAGKPSLATPILVGATVLFLFGFVMMREYKHYYELYIFAFMFEFAIVVACLVGRTRVLPWAVAGASFALVLTAYVLRVLPRGDEAAAKGAPETLFFIGLFFAMSGFMGGELMKSVDAFILLAKGEMEKNRKRIAELGSVMLSVREGMAVGDKLLSFVGENEKRVLDSERRLGDVGEDFNMLAARMDKARAGNVEIASLAETVKANTRIHATDLLETSSAIEQINATIDSVSRGTEEKRARLTELQSLIDGGATDMERSHAAIGKIAESSAAITEIGKMIQKISSQTNLLAMNANIEAAHAGDYGKGFAVVANEIRALAEQTNANATQITKTLKEISAEIGQARDVNRKAGEGFRAIEAEVGTVSEAMAGFFSALAEIRSGIAEITKAVVGIRESSVEIQEAVGAISERSGASVAEIAALESALRGHASSVEAVLGVFAGMTAGMAELEGMGKENLGVIAKVNQAVASIGKA